MRRMAHIRCRPTSRSTIVHVQLTKLVMNTCTIKIIVFEVNPNFERTTNNLAFDEVLEIFIWTLWKTRHWERGEQSKRKFVQVQAFVWWPSFCSLCWEFRRSWINSGIIWVYILYCLVLHMLVSCSSNVIDVWLVCIMACCSSDIIDVLLVRHYRRIARPTS